MSTGADVSCIGRTPPEGITSLLLGAGASSTNGFPRSPLGRMVACVPRCSGAAALSTWITTLAPPWLPSASGATSTETTFPTLAPLTTTSFAAVRPSALRKYAVTRYGWSPPQVSSPDRTPTAATTPASTLITLPTPLTGGGGRGGPTGPPGPAPGRLRRPMAEPRCSTE